jgi:transcriptional regulator with XRE-family HTH domain
LSRVRLPISIGLVVNPPVSENGALGPAVRRLRKERGLSLEDAVFEIRGAGFRLSAGYLGMIERGEKQPSIEAIEAIARALGVAAGTFAEYRLALARRQLDEREVGLDQALANLEAAGLSPDGGIEEAVERLAADVGSEAPPGRVAGSPRTADAKGSPKKAA